MAMTKRRRREEEDGKRKTMLICLLFIEALNLNDDDEDFCLAQTGCGEAIARLRRGGVDGLRLLSAAGQFAIN